MRRGGLLVFPTTGMALSSRHSHAWITEGATR